MSALLPTVILYIFITCFITNSYLMSLIEGDSIYSLFPNHDLGLDFTSGLVPDSPNKFGNVNTTPNTTPPINNNNNNNVNNQVQQHTNGANMQNPSGINGTYNLNNKKAPPQSSNGYNGNTNGFSQHQQVHQPPQMSHQQQQQQQQQHHLKDSNQAIQISTPLPPYHQQQQQHHNLQQQHQPSYSQHQQMQPIHNGGMEEQIYSLFLASEKDNSMNIIPDFNCSPNQLNLNMYNGVKLEDSYSNGIVPDSSLTQDNNVLKKIDFINEPMKQHYFVPGSAYEMPLIVQNNNNNNPNNKNVTNNKTSAKRKEDDNKIKKRKFITSTPVKSENGTMLIPTPDGSVNPEEEKHMKRQRRLVKNREAAQLFRQRQKAYIQDLEKKVHDLTTNNSEFRARTELLNSENKLIREQLMYLRNFITQAVSFTFPKGPNGSPNGSPSSMEMPPGLSAPLPPGILPPGMMNLQNPMIMSAIAEATKNSQFRQNINSVMSIPSPPSLSIQTQQVPYMTQNTPPQQTISPPSVPINQQSSPNGTPQSNSPNNNNNNNNNNNISPKRQK
ncbi:putative basic-leucine zipper transcription factor [Heterostelium album PN500]|uniref:Putative basic-leucine zipper transcription factor n=1 Tax=Heterostelium pallidum (strain ATCC 26659 / Pp 5 / PN500) TaxID=670386 RepID=D3BIM3_HETP5|nr:putative basic-leucine zipper transcription factor [Heterostelium album PN500]EFA78647.1 putative basic-leucine zipper transcription factor [Heterostelium album PN500]|eukprot:XP_020430771.1 putative basic-leucine zipper transcription factor [Heterostelium album PN500]